MKAVGYYVFIKQEEIEEKSEGGILLTANAVGINQAQHTIGTIMNRGDVAFTGGDWGENDRDALCPGTRVLFKKHAGQKYKPKRACQSTDPAYHMCKDDDVIGIYDEQWENSV
jgi:co-chaperonin GroES (HSP10)